MRHKLIMANWKMNVQRTHVEALLTAFRDTWPVVSSVSTVIFPPAIYIPMVQTILTPTGIAWGAQNIYTKDVGAFTGEHSSSMLTDFGCQYVLVGHSERRHVFHENEKFVAEKFHQVKVHDMIPVLCVGETLDARENGLTEAVLVKQLQAIAAVGPDSFKNCVIAYEPVWAIGTGKTAAPEQAQAVHQFIRHWIATVNPTDAANVPIIYGGSVTEKNAHALFAMPDIDGGLVGNASLNAQQFLEIVKCIK